MACSCSHVSWHPSLLLRSDKRGWRDPIHRNEITKYGLGWIADRSFGRPSASDLAISVWSQDGDRHVQPLHPDPEIASVTWLEATFGRDVANFGWAGWGLVDRASECPDELINRRVVAGRGEWFCKDDDETIFANVAIQFQATP